MIKKRLSKESIMSLNFTKEMFTQELLLQA